VSIPPVEKAVTIITGASSGIGRACALAYARSGAVVVLASRDAARLRQVADAIRRNGDAEPLIVPADVTQTVQVERLAEATISAYGRIDILVCNAGVGLYAPVASLPGDALQRVFDVNFFGVVRGIQAALPHMLGRRSGLIQIVSSLIGVRAVPGYAGYCATKFALAALAESLRVEVQGAGLRVQMIYPGLTDTDFAVNAIRRGPDPATYRIKAAPPEKVAKVIVRAARRGSRDQFVSFSGRLLAAVNKISPSLVDAILARVLQGPVSG